MLVESDVLVPVFFHLIELPFEGRRGGEFSSREPLFPGPDGVPINPPPTKALDGLLLKAFGRLFCRTDVHAVENTLFRAGDERGLTI